MKATLFFAVIVSFLPVFLLLTYGISTWHRLSALRERCRTGDDRTRAIVDYDAARKAFPASLVAKLFGFRAVDAGPHNSVS